MYQVRLAAGLLRPDVQFKRSVSPIRYFLLNPSIDGPWEGNSAEQETSGTHGARKYAKHVRNAALTFDHSYVCILYMYIIYIYTRTHIYNGLGLDIGVEETFQDSRMRQRNQCVHVCIERVDRSTVLSNVCWWKILLLCLAIRARVSISE